MDYKLDKEAFVANNTGTSVFNVLLISSVGWVSGRHSMTPHSVALVLGNPISGST
jgi:hypothetical protein